MSASGFDSSLWTAVLIGLATAVGVIRLLLWQRAAPVPARAPAARLALLIALQVAAGGLLHLVLHPPGAVIRTGALVVATRDAPAAIALGPRDRLVALPEAGPVEGAARVPDLATALRRHPGAARLRVVGAGLTARDRAPPHVPLEFAPPPLPRGLVELTSPEPTAPGAPATVSGRVGSLPAGVVELLDPAEAIVDREPIAAGGRFTLSAVPRTAGLSLFTLRLRDGKGALVEQIAVPVVAIEQAPPRVLVLAGAPEPEIKYLRRWAEDSGIDLRVRIDLGAGVELGDAPEPLSAATLNRLDLVILDERRWEALAAGTRATLISAVEGGLGLLLRPTGPLSPAVRSDWAALGLPLAEGADGRPVRLSPTPTSPAAGEAAEPEVLPQLTGRDLGHEGPRAVSLLRDADGAALASWRPRGRGRLGVLAVSDSYALVLTGRPDRYGELWSALFSALARPVAGGRARVDGWARAGSRVALCDLIGRAEVLGPAGKPQPLIVDPGAGRHACAAFWPGDHGWHLVRDGTGRETPIYAQPADAAPSLVAAADRADTLAMAGSPPAGRRPPAEARTPGSPWPWFAGLLGVLAGLWWLERNRSPFRPTSST